MTPLVSVVAGFAGGVFVRSCTAGWDAVMFFTVAAGIFGVCRYFKPHIFYTLAVVVCCCAALGAARMALSDSPLPEMFASHVGERVQYTGVVVSDPDIREKNQRVTLEVHRGGQSVRMLAVAKKEPVVSVGDTVWVSGTLALPQPFDTEGGRVFRYDKYLERDGVRFMLNFAYLRSHAEAPSYSIPSFLARIKHAFQSGLSAALPHPYDALAGGIVIGGKTGLGTELHDAFVKSGLVQIIVLSGYNVMIVATWIMTLLSLTPLSRRWITVSGAAALIIFVGIAGFSATAIRAMCMALIALYARATGRTYDAGRALLVVILFMLLWNPLFLVFDPGFGLSVVATAGLIWFTPIIEQKFRWIHSSFWREIVATTFAAQLAVLPLLLYDMGILSLVAIPANLIVSPVVPLAMGASAIAGFAGMVFGHAAPLLALPAKILTWFIIKVATVSSSFSWSILVLPAFPFWVVFGAYALLIYRAARASKRLSTTPQFRFAKKASR